MMDVIAAVTPLLLAQAAEAAGGSGNIVQTVWDFIIKGGVLMIPIALCSLVALAVIVERAVSLRRKRVIPPGFEAGLKNALGESCANRKVGLEFCRTQPSPMASIAAAALKHADEPRDLLEKHIEQAGAREVLKLRKYLRTLAVIVSLAPMLGLLGTVFGMIQAFQTVAASAEALGRTEMLAKGIYEALVTTAAGLMVAVPAMIGYHWLTSKVERLVAEMDLAAVDLVDQCKQAAPTMPPAREVVRRVGDDGEQEAVTAGAGAGAEA